GWNSTPQRPARGEYSEPPAPAPSAKERHMAEKTAPARRTVILDNAARLFAEQGIGGTSVREISASVGMLSGSLYHHFASKDEMVEEILTEFLEELQGRYRSVTDSGTEPREALNQLIRITLEIIRDFPYATQI